MKLCFFENNPIQAQNFENIKSHSGLYGSILYLINFGDSVEQSDNGALLYLYEEMDRLGSLYEFLINLNLFQNNNHSRFDYIAGSSVRTSLEGYFRVRYIFSGLRDWKSENASLLVQERYDEVCGSFLNEYNRFYSKSKDAGFSDGLTDCRDLSFTINKLNTFDFLKKGIEAERKITICDEDQTLMRQYLRYRQLCLYSHGNVSKSFGKKFNLAGMIGYNNNEELEKIAKSYITLLRMFGLSDQCGELLDNKIYKVMNNL